MKDNVNKQDRVNINEGHSGFIRNASEAGSKIVSLEQKRESLREQTAKKGLSLTTPVATDFPKESLPDLICLSHLRWDFVYQRPQHLLSRCARSRRVFFIEEPIFDEGPVRLDVSQRDDNVWVVVPHLPGGEATHVAMDAMLQGLLDRLFAEHEVRDYVLWYYTPMALGWTRHLKPLAVIYDCMDELSAFRGAPLTMREREAELFRLADLVFTGGQSLYEAKRHQHPHVYAFPSSVDTAHFARAREIVADPEDQAPLAHPRIGFYGVVDERFDIELLRAAAEARPDWQWVIIGPVVKIDPAELPRAANIHYLGGKSYQELPAYLSGWDVAMMPFARNESTRFISPTKTPEYLAAGRPVVSTSIRDVVRPYEQLGLARIADEPADFVAAIEQALHEDASTRQQQADAFLARNSWDRTWARMQQLIDEVVRVRRSTLVAAAYSQPALRAASASGD